MPRVTSHPSLQPTDTVSHEKEKSLIELLQENQMKSAEQRFRLSFIPVKPPKDKLQKLGIIRDQLFLDHFIEFYLAHSWAKAFKLPQLSEDLGKRINLYFSQHPIANTTHFKAIITCVEHAFKAIDANEYQHLKERFFTQKSQLLIELDSSYENYKAFDDLIKKQFFFTEENKKIIHTCHETWKEKTLHHCEHFTPKITLNQLSLSANNIEQEIRPITPNKDTLEGMGNEALGSPHTPKKQDLLGRSRRPSRVTPQKQPVYDETSDAVATQRDYLLNEWHRLSEQLTRKTELLKKAEQRKTELSQELCIAEKTAEKLSLAKEEAEKATLAYEEKSEALQAQLIQQTVQNETLHKAIQQERHRRSSSDDSLDKLRARHALEVKQLEAKQTQLNEKAYKLRRQLDITKKEKKEIEEGQKMDAKKIKNFIAILRELNPQWSWEEDCDGFNALFNYEGIDVVARELTKGKQLADDNKKLSKQIDVLEESHNANIQALITQIREGKQVMEAISVNNTNTCAENSSSACIDPLNKLTEIVKSIQTQTAVLCDDIMSRLDQLESKGSLKETILSPQIGRTVQDLQVLRAKLLFQDQDFKQGSLSVASDYLYSDTPLQPKCSRDSGFFSRSLSRQDSGYGSVTSGLRSVSVSGSVTTPYEPDELPLQGIRIDGLTELATELDALSIHLKAVDDQLKEQQITNSVISTQLLTVRAEHVTLEMCLQDLIDKIVPWTEKAIQIEKDNHALNEQLQNIAIQDKLRKLILWGRSIAGHLAQFPSVSIVEKLLEHLKLQSQPYLWPDAEEGKENSTESLELFETISFIEENLPTLSNVQKKSRIPYIALPWSAVKVYQPFDLFKQDKTNYQWGKNWENKMKISHSALPRENKEQATVYLYHKKGKGEFGRLAIKTEEIVLNLVHFIVSTAEKNPGMVVILTGDESVVCELAHYLAVSKELYKKCSMELNFIIKTPTLEQLPELSYPEVEARYNRILRSLPFAELQAVTGVRRCSLEDELNAAEKSSTPSLVSA